MDETFLFPTYDVKCDDVLKKTGNVAEEWKGCGFGLFVNVPSF